MTEPYEIVYKEAIVALAALYGTPMHAIPWTERQDAAAMQALMAAGLIHFDGTELVDLRDAVAVRAMLDANT